MGYVVVYGKGKNKSSFNITKKIAMSKLNVGERIFKSTNNKLRRVYIIR